MSTLARRPPEAPATPQLDSTQPSTAQSSTAESSTAESSTAESSRVEAVRLVRAGRARRTRSRRRAVTLLAVATVAVFCASLMMGESFYTPAEVVRVILGQEVPGASFTVGELRLPRAVLCLLVGASFGMAGVTFQTMLRNALASPDVIGISSGASAAAVIAIVVLHLPDATVSLFALVGSLATAMVIYLLSWRGGMVGTRLILIGIGVSAMLHAVVSWAVVHAATWDLQAAMQWLSGSVNRASWGSIAPLAALFVVATPLLAAQQRGLRLMQLGDDAAQGLGEDVGRRRVLSILTAVALIAFATAAAGPIAFVAFLAGPIAARIVGAGGSLLAAAALVGALLVMGSDAIGQYAFASRFPVGVVTGALGAPYLIHLLIRTNSSGGSL